MIIKDKYKIIKNCTTKSKLVTRVKLLRLCLNILMIKLYKKLELLIKKFIEIQNLDNIIKELQSDSDDENFIEVYSN